MSGRLNITVMLGGPSAEREVSLRSGAGVVKALRSLGHTVFEMDPKTPDWVLPPDTDVVCLAPLHGTYGEDGQVQRQLEKLGVVYTGCDSESSRLAFDKVLTKKLCIEAGVPTAKFLVVGSKSAPLPENLHLPLVVKPVRQGSSVGLRFVECAADWHGALAEALKFDSEVLVEEKIAGRETTVGILDDRALPVVEVRPRAGTYDYHNKYTAGCTEYFCPADFDAVTTQTNPSRRARRVSRGWRTRLCARGCDGARGWLAGRAGSQHAAGHDGNEPAAKGGGGGGIGLRGALPADD